MWILRVSVLFLAFVGTVLAAGNAKQSPNGSNLKHQDSQLLPSESETASEVEYVDGPLAPFYDFLIQKRLYKFCKLLRDAGLDQTLQDLGSYWTVFVPTDSSFVFLPGGTLDEIKRDPQRLRDFLLYHFVTGDFPTSQILDEMLVNSAQGAPLRFNIYGQEQLQILTVSGARILESDLEFEQGRVNIVDHPLYPMPVSDTISYLRTSHPQFFKLLQDTGLEEYVSSGTFTILAPDENAFNFLSDDLKNVLASNATLAQRIALNHILPASVYTGGITDGMSWQTVGESPITFTSKRGLIFANDIPIVLPDMPFTNGIIHTINRVILPEDIENDCHCKPSTRSSTSRTTAPRQPALRTTLRPQSPFNKPNEQSQGWRAQTPGAPGDFNRNRPTQAPRIPPTPRGPFSQPLRPVSPSRVGQTVRPVSPPNQVTRTLSTQSLPDDDINAVIGPRSDTRTGQQKPEFSRSTTLSPVLQRTTTTRRPIGQFQPSRAQTPQTVSENEVIIPDQEISPIVTNTPRQNSRWVNRQPTQAPRYPTPARRTYWTPGTTSWSSTTELNSQTTPSLSGRQPDQSFSTTVYPGLPSQRPSSQTNTWQSRQQVSVAGRGSNQGRNTTPRFNQYPSQPPQRQRPTPNRVTASSALPQEQNQSFESNRQALNCRQAGERVTSLNQNLPICQNNQRQCQNPPYSPSDPRPMCSDNLKPSDCRRVGDPFNPNDNRPICVAQECRNPRDPTFAGDVRPLCNQNQVGCRNPSVPQNLNDNRPLCRNQANIVNPTQATPGQVGIQVDCRPFNERPQLGDRRPVCRINNQQTQPNDANKGQRVPPRNRQTQTQNNRFPNAQTGRRQSWQSTTRSPQPAIQPIISDTQQMNIPPPTGNVRPISQPNPPQRQPIQIRPQNPPQQPQRNPDPASGRRNIPPQPGPRSQFNQQVTSNTRQNQTPLTRAPFTTVFQPTSAPQTTRQPISPSSQTQRPLSQTRGTPSPLNNPALQTPSISQRQPISPQRRPVFVSGPPLGSVTPQNGRFSTPRVPVSGIGTSTTPGEDSRRTLYEIVEDPSLLIRGRPVKLTKVFELFHSAGIEDILNQPGPSTAFLPSDDAFAMLPKGVVDQLEENPELLRKILLYHITNSEILPSADSESYTVPSLEGTQLVITMLNGGRLIMISGAKAIAVTRASNGIFYVINQLLYPLPHDNLMSAIQSRPDLSTFASLLSTSGLADRLQGTDAYTILAPTDNAFAQLPQSAIDELLQDEEALQGLLLNHIVEGAHYGREFLTGVTYPSARGGKLRFQVVSYGYQVNDVNIKTPEIVTGTGVIHLIDQVLLENSDKRFLEKFDNPVTDFGDILTNDEQPFPFNDFQSNRVNGGQNNPGTQPPTPGSQQTSFNPSQPNLNKQLTPRRPSQQAGQRFDFRQPNSNNNQGQAAQSAGLQPPSNQWAGQRNPVGRTTNPDQNLSNGQQQTSPPRNSNQVHNTGRSRVQNRNRPSSNFGPSGTRQPTSNSLNSRQPVFQPAALQGNENGGSTDSNVAELARSMGLNRFANWLTDTGLLEKVHDGGIYTVFAPTDEAVNSLPDDLVNSLETNPMQTKSLLQYHIIPRKININSIRNEETSSTLLQGKTIRFNVYSNAQANCHQVVTASGTPVGDPQATMGSIQVIPVTQVLYQPTGNLLNIIDASPILTNLSQAIKSARLSWILSANGPLTFFAPSDSAFQALSADEKKAILEDKQALTDLLKKHLLRGTYFSTGVQNDLQKSSENGQEIGLSLQNSVLTVNSQPVAYSDITATNGVLHVIDHFL